MTVLTLEHAPDCTGPSLFYEIRNGWAWMACRHCGRTIVRPPANTQETRRGK